MSLPLTGSQTVGPFFSIGLNYLCRERVPSLDAGEPVQVEGFLLDADRLPIPDAVLEVWCADKAGRYADATSDQSATRPECPGFARVSTNAEGRFFFTVIKPGNVAYDAERLQAPHLVVLIFMRGLLRNLVTRMYFPGDTCNATDPVLELIPGDRRDTLIPQLTANGRLEWTIVMKGQGETVFFAW
jgi:protocatechuate 3,4-dioxygenase alpha subunit